MGIRKMGIVLTVMLFAANTFGQTKSIDGRIGDAMNRSDWSELRSLYYSEGKGLQIAFLHPLSKFFINQFFNRPDSAIEYGKVILEKYQDELSSTVPSIIYFMASDYAVLGHYDKAFSLLHSLNEAYRKGGQSLNPIFEGYEDMYSVLAQYGAFSVEKPTRDVFVPLSVYMGENKNPEMLYVTVIINGNGVKCNYDTGAGVNIMTPEFAQRIGAKVIRTRGIQMAGMSNVESGDLVVLDSMKMGEVVYRNVPFVVTNIKTNNVLVDKKLKDLDYSCVIGNQTMMPLGEICLDFEKMQLVVPAVYSAAPAFAPNFYCSQDRMLHLSMTDGLTGKRIDALVDTGSSSSFLTYRYYKDNEASFNGKSASDSLRMAGIGGIAVRKIVHTPLSYTVADGKYHIEDIPVVVSPNSIEDYDCLMGLPSLMAHKKVCINFNDMWMDFDN